MEAAFRVGLRVSWQLTNLLLLIQQKNKQNLYLELKQFMVVKRVMVREELRLRKHLQKNVGQKMSAVSYFETVTVKQAWRKVKYLYKG